MHRPVVSSEGMMDGGHPENSLITDGWTTVLPGTLLAKSQGREHFLENSTESRTALQCSSTTALTIQILIS